MNSAMVTKGLITEFLNKGGFSAHYSGNTKTMYLGVPPQIPVHSIHPSILKASGKRMIREILESDAFSHLPFDISLGYVLADMPDEIAKPKKTRAPRKTKGLTTLIDTATEKTIQEATFTTQPEVETLMGSSKSEHEWNQNCDKVKAANNGYPDFWYSAIIMSGLLERTQRANNWG